MHFYRNVFSLVPRGKMRAVAAMLKAIHAQESREEARSKANAVVAKLIDMRLPKAAELVREGIDETLSYYVAPEKARFQGRRKYLDMDLTVEPELEAQGTA